MLPVDTINGDNLSDTVSAALDSGFTKLVLVSQKENVQALSDMSDDRIVTVNASEELKAMGYDISAGQIGSTLTLMACKKVIQEPFAFVTGSEYCDGEIFSELLECITHEKLFDRGRLIMYLPVREVQDTIPKGQQASRKLCLVNEEDRLLSVREKNICRSKTGIITATDNAIDGETLASLEIWGMSPYIFNELEKQYMLYQRRKTITGATEELEFDQVVDNMIKTSGTEVNVVYC